MTGPPASAHFIWCDPQRSGRNVFALFRRRLQLPRPPRVACLHLFADTAYRLIVNGHVAGYGPARFFPRHPQFDTVDLAPWLRPGRNTILVEVHQAGAPCFQAISGPGGFIAWGHIGSENLATPGHWETCRLRDRDPAAPPFSFAIGPVEIRDTRHRPGPWRRPVLHPQPDHWGPLTPRTTPLLSRHECPPARLLRVAPVARHEIRVGYRVALDVPESAPRKPHTQFITWIYSPLPQSISLGLFWGDYYLNGHRLRRRDQPHLGNRQTARARLRAGWNLLFGDVEILSTAWTVLLALPRGRSLALAAEPRLHCPHVLRHAEPVEPWTGPPPRRADDLPPHHWQPVARATLAGNPAREMAWDQLLPAPQPSAEPLPAKIVLPAGKSDATAAVFDFGGEFLGHPRIEIQAPAGTILDVGVAESLRGDGALHLYGSHHGIHAADRYRLRGGRQIIETFHPRGGRYLQLTVRNACAPVTLRRVSLRQTITPVAVRGQFACSDPILTWAWETGRDTLRAGLEDAYVDCPWRERGAYIADSYVSFHTHRMLSDDLSVAARTLTLFAQGQRADGQLPACAPAEPARVILDFTLIWILWLRDFWAATADRRLVRSLWPVIGRIFASPVWRETGDGLWDVDATDGFVFIDWSVTREARRGANGVLNAFRFRALVCAAELARQLGRAAEAHRYQREAQRVRQAFQRLWDRRAGHFAAFRRGAVLADEPAWHVNCLALAFGLTDGRQADTVREYLRQGLPRTWREQPGGLDLYFFQYLLAALYRHGDAAGAESAVRAVYGRLRQRGVWTLPEIFSARRKGVGSQCHPWSSSPCRYLMEHVLGVQAARPGQTRDWIVAPRTAAVDWARGVMPTPHGDLAVAWQRRGRQLDIEVTPAAGLRVRVERSGR